MQPFLFEGKRCRSEVGRIDLPLSNLLASASMLHFGFSCLSLSLSLSLSRAQSISLYDSIYLSLSFLRVVTTKVLGIGGPPAKNASLKDPNC